MFKNCRRTNLANCAEYILAKSQEEHFIRVQMTSVTLKLVCLSIGNNQHSRLLSQEKGHKTSCCCPTLSSTKVKGLLRLGDSTAWEHKLLIFQFTASVRTTKQTLRLWNKGSVKDPRSSHNRFHKGIKIVPGAAPNPTSTHAYLCHHLETPSSVLTGFRPWARSTGCIFNSLLVAGEGVWLSEIDRRQLNFMLGLFTPSETTAFEAVAWTSENQLTSACPRAKQRKVVVGLKRKPVIDLPQQTNCSHSYKTEQYHYDCTLKGCKLPKCHGLKIVKVELYLYPKPDTLAHSSTQFIFDGYTFLSRPFWMCSGQITWKGRPVDFKFEMKQRVHWCSLVCEKHLARATRLQSDGRRSDQEWSGLLPAFQVEIREMTLLPREQFEIFLLWLILIGNTFCKRSWKKEPPNFFLKHIFVDQQTKENKLQEHWNFDKKVPFSREQSSRTERFGARVRVTSCPLLKATEGLFVASRTYLDFRRA